MSFCVVLVLVVVVVVDVVVVVVVVVVIVVVFVVAVVVVGVVRRGETQVKYEGNAEGISGTREMLRKRIGGAAEHVNSEGNALGAPGEEAHVNM